MPDVSMGLVQVEGPGTFAYALRTADNKAWNFTTNLWEPALPAIDAAHLKTMTAIVWGPAQWSQDVIPSVLAQVSQVVAIIYVVDSKGVPTAYQGNAVFQSAANSGITIFQGK